MHDSIRWELRWEKELVNPLGCPSVGLAAS